MCCFMLNTHLFCYFNRLFPLLIHQVAIFSVTLRECSSLSFRLLEMMNGGGKFIFVKETAHIELVGLWLIMFTQWIQILLAFKMYLGQLGFVFFSSLKMTVSNQLTWSTGINQQLLVTSQQNWLLCSRM